MARFDPRALWHPLLPVFGVLLLVHIPANGMRFAVLLHGVELGASPAVIGALGACFFVLPVLMALRVGRLVDRIGARAPLAASCAILAASAVLGAFAQSVAMLIAMSFVAGVGQNLYVVAVNRAVGEHGTGVERAVSFSLLALAYSIATFIAPVAAGLAIQHGGLIAAYIGAALLPLPGLLLLRSKRMQLPRGHGGRGPQAAMPSASALALLREPNLRRTYLTGALFETSWSLFAFLSPVYGAQLGLPAGVIGLVTGSISISAMAMRLFTPFIVRRVPMWRALIVSLCVLSVGFLGFSLVSAAALLIGFGLLIGVGQSMGGPLINAHLFEISPPGRAGEAIGIRTTFNSLLALLIPLTSGVVTAAIGIAPAFWVLSAGLAGGAWAVRRQWHKA